MEFSTYAMGTNFFVLLYWLRYPKFPYFSFLYCVTKEKGYVAIRRGRIKIELEADHRVLVLQLGLSCLAALQSVVNKELTGG